MVIVLSIKNAFYHKYFHEIEQNQRKTDKIIYKSVFYSAKMKLRKVCKARKKNRWILHPAYFDIICEKLIKQAKEYASKEREIPLLYEKEEGFPKELTTTGILKNNNCTVPSGNSREILLDAGSIKNGYPRYQFEGGKGRKVPFTYFEKFVNNEKTIKRTDWENGEIIGLEDSIILNGTQVNYEPFWYRTFRFLRIRIEAGEEAVTVFHPTFKKTGYPLQIESWVRSSETWVEKVWDMCVRTLKNCMTETYMDCPYYEQMQYPMDTRLQAMFNYAVSTDVRLARKALEDFHSSMLPDGLIQGKYPSAYCQVIATFSLHYIFMISEYYQQTKDMETVKRYRPDVDAILEYYDRKIGADGLVGPLGYWEFVDWQKAWGECMGMPAARQKGPSTIINLMYGYALHCGAVIYEATGRKGMAEEYRMRQRAIIMGVQQLCWDEGAGMYREGPDVLQFSQHAQAWAILNGMADQTMGRVILRRTIGNDSVIKCSFSTAYELFRAMEKADMYGGTEDNMRRWIGLLDLECTTCPEDPENGRSDCHAWSALPMYEMIRCMAGIQIEKAGWESVVIKPHLDYLPDLEGEAVTPKGRIRFCYKKENETWNYLVTLPKGMSGTLVLPDGTKKSL